MPTAYATERGIVIAIGRGGGLEEFYQIRGEWDHPEIERISTDEAHELVRGK